jgi:hypothetical protein
MADARLGTLRLRAQEAVLSGELVAFAGVQGGVAEVRTAPVQLLMGLRQVEDAMTDPVGDRITQLIDDVREVMRRVRRVPAR